MKELTYLKKVHDLDSDGSEVDEAQYDGFRNKSRRIGPKLKVDDMRNDSSDVSEEDSDEDNVTLRDKKNGNENGDSENESKPNSALDIEQFKKENLLGSESATKFDALEENEVQIEAFNLEEETQNGTYDRDGNYIRNESDGKKDSLLQDNWIDDFSSTEQALAAQNSQVEYMRKQRIQAQKKKRRYLLESAIFRLEFMVFENETVLKSMDRLNKLRKNKKYTESAIPYITNAIEFVSDLVEILETKGIKDVYNLTRSGLHQLFIEEMLDDSDQIDNYKSKIWSFKWLEKPEKLQEQHTNYEMQYWKKVYFEGRVLVKLDDDQDEERNWIHVDCVKFM